MINFRQFLEDAENNDVQETLHKLPKKHQLLVKGYKIKFQSGHTLKGDKQHVGYVDDGPKEIVIAAPWNYSRSFTFLHEIGHMVYSKLEDNKKQEWKKIFSKTKKKPQQNAEEAFCMAYANFYSLHKVKTYDFPSWNNFIKEISST